MTKKITGWPSPAVQCYGGLSQAVLVLACLVAHPGLAVLLCIVPNKFVVLSLGSHKTVKTIMHCKDCRTERLFSLVLHWQNLLDWQALGFIVI